MIVTSQRINNLVSLGHQTCPQKEVCSLSTAGIGTGLCEDRTVTLKLHFPFFSLCWSVRLAAKAQEWGQHPTSGIPSRAPGMIAAWDLLTLCCALFKRHQHKALTARITTASRHSRNTSNTCPCSDGLPRKSLFTGPYSHIPLGRCLWAHQGFVFVWLSFSWPKD